MKGCLAAIFLTGVLIALPAPAAEPVDPAACLSARLTVIAEATTFLDQTAAVVVKSVDPGSYAVVKLVGELRATAVRVGGQVRAALQAPPEDLERALIAASLGMSVLRSKVARLNLALIDADEAAKRAGAEMSQRVRKVQAAIPPADPAGGCRPAEPPHE